MSANKKQIPQAGTADSGESRPPSGGCPYVSGGDIRCTYIWKYDDFGKRNMDTENQKESSAFGSKPAAESTAPLRLRGGADKGDDKKPARDAKGRFIRPRTPAATSTPAESRVGSDSESEFDASFMSVTSGVSASKGSETTRRKRTASFDVPEPKRAAQADTEADEDGGVTDPTVAPRNARTKKSLPKPDELAKEMAELPTSEVEERIRQNLMSVEKVADTSSHLKGSYVRVLRMAARSVQAAGDELARRSCAEHNAERLERENAELRSQLTSLSARVEGLTRELSAMRRPNNSQPTTTAAARKPTPPAVTVARSGSDDWERRLMERISALIDAKLGQAGPSLSLPTTEAPTARSSTSSKRRKKKKKPNRDNEQPEAPTTSRAAAVPSGASAARSPAAPSGSEHTAGSAETWSQVVGRKARKKTSAPNALQPRRATPAPPSTRGKAPVPSKLPNTAAVVITVAEGAELSYAAVMRAAKERVNLSDCGVTTGLRLRRAQTGGMILQIPGPENVAKADNLATKLREALSDLAVQVSRPVKSGEVRVMDLDEAVTQAEVAAAVAAAGECSPNDVRAGELRRSRSGLQSAWVRCPLAAVRKLQEAKRIAVGWASARVEVLEARPMRCFRCLEPGHVGRQCPGGVDRSDCCFACGQKGHKARECTAANPRCPVCSDMNRPANHRLGAKACKPPKRGRGRKQTPSLSVPGTEQGAEAAPAEQGENPAPVAAMET